MPLRFKIEKENQSKLCNFEPLKLYKMNYILLMVLLEMRYALYNTRPVADILISDDTTKWEMQLGSTTTTLTEEYLSEKYPY
jgi:hypothetical protein